jgi:GT2 family glycosyltransferase
MKIYSEDHDLCARIYHAGFCIRYTTDAIVYHKHRINLQGTWRQGFGYGTGHAALLKKHFQSLVIIDIPKFQYLSKRWSLRLWVDIASADKKFLAIILLSLAWWPLFFANFIYLLFLFENIGKRLKQNSLKANFIEKWQLVFLLIFKSTAISCGRIVGSFRNKVLCC